MSTCVWICQSSHNRNCKKSSERSKKEGWWDSIAVPRSYSRRAVQTVRGHFQGFGENKPSTTKALLRNYPLCWKNSTSGVQRSLTRRPNTWMFSPCYTGKQLPTAQKREHTMSNCKSYNVRHSETLALFPVNSNNIRGKALKNPVFAASQVNDSLRGAAGKVSPTQREIKSAARSIYNTIAPSFHQTYNVTLAEALSQVSELNLQNKTKSDLQEVRRQHYRATKESVEKQMEETAFAR